jgi:hypothetical protein
MVQPVSWSDATNTPDPNNGTGSFLGERIMLFRYQRPGISNDTRTAVDAFGDGAGTGTYKHHIPWGRIFQTMLTDMETRIRGDIIGYLDTVMNRLGIADSSNLDPQRTRLEFDAWVTWVTEEVGDWPGNLFRWPHSTGDANGTAVDHPLHANGALVARLAKAARALNFATGVSTA